MVGHGNIFQKTKIPNDSARVGYRLQKPYRGTLLHTAVRTTVYSDGIKLTNCESFSSNGHTLNCYAHILW